MRARTLNYHMTTQRIWIEEVNWNEHKRYEPRKKRTFQWKECRDEEKIEPTGKSNSNLLTTHYAKCSVDALTKYFVQWFLFCVCLVSFVILWLVLRAWPSFSSRRKSSNVRYADAAEKSLSRRDRNILMRLEEQVFFHLNEEQPECISPDHIRMRIIIPNFLDYFISMWMTFSECNFQKTVTVFISLESARGK